MNKTTGQALLEVLSILLLVTPLLLMLQQQCQAQALQLQQLQQTMQAQLRISEAALTLAQRRLPPLASEQISTQGELHQWVTPVDSQTGLYRVQWQWISANPMQPLLRQQGLWLR